MIIKAPVNLETLRWAREMAGYPTIEDVCEKSSLHNYTDNGFNLLRDWESGKRQLSVADADELAKIYGFSNRVSLYANKDAFKKK